MGELVTFGEAMVRLSPPECKRLEQTPCLDLNVGGSELNVAVAAARLGIAVSYVTRLTENALGRIIRNKCREQGVDTSNIAWTDEDRVGTYFVEFGAAPRANSVIYDRKDSAIARLDPEVLDWERILTGATIFHTSGITPALSEGCEEATRQALKTAGSLGVRTSMDLNYRKNLWSSEQARSVMEDLLPLVDVLITTEEDSSRVLGVEKDNYEDVAAALAERFDLELVAITLRETPGVWWNRWTAIAYSQGKTFRADTYDIEVVDRVGSGDAFAGGFLYGLLRHDVEEAVRYGVAVSALKQTNPGDFSWATLDEVERTIGSRSLRIVR